MPRLIEVEPSEVTLTPSSLLGVILKSVLDERITDEEINRICAEYYEAIVTEYC